MLTVKIALVNFQFRISEKRKFKSHTNLCLSNVKCVKYSYRTQNRFQLGLYKLQLDQNQSGEVVQNVTGDWEIACYTRYKIKANQGNGLI